MSHQCPTCGKSYQNYKSYHRHKTTKHPELIMTKADRICEYNQSPYVCAYCSTPLAYEKRFNKFCNKSCAASFNNTSRDLATKEKVLDTWRSKLGQIRRDDPSAWISPKYVRPRARKYPQQRICKGCKDEFIANSPRHVYCNPACNTSKNSKAIYRAACQFKLNKNDHPELFSSTLIEEYGWYSPRNKPGKTNLTGVCWDHLFSIADGYNKKVPPEIMAHPANAELVPWKENRKRWKKSTITYEELMKRIQQWENGDRTLPKFFHC
jgi:hypothetical protein